MKGSVVILDTNAYSRLMQAAICSFDHHMKAMLAHGVELIEMGDENV